MNVFPLVELVCSNVSLRLMGVGSLDVMDSFRLEIVEEGAIGLGVVWLRLRFGHIRLLRLSSLNGGDGDGVRLRFICCGVGRGGRVCVFTGGAIVGVGLLGARVGVSCDCGDRVDRRVSGEACCGEGCGGGLW